MSASDVVTEAECTLALELAPTGSVVVDPYDERGDAPVVGCKNAWGFWALLGEKDADRVWLSVDVARASRGRARIVYTPAVADSATH